VESELLGAAVVSAVEPGSSARQAGVRQGDRIIEIDGERLRDTIDLQLLLADDVPHRLEIERNGGAVQVTVESLGRPIGIEVDKPVFGNIMTCNNSCMFCFIDQLPGGLRETMYVKDDDYRLSFLGGNFITLTNLGDGDIRRIIDEKLSPLYVSLHATEPGLRVKLFGNKGANIALDALGVLLDGGIDIHIQVVLIRGVNDRERLDETLGDIMSCFPGVSSVGVVPVGITTTGRIKLPVSFGHTRESASELLEQLDRWRRDMDAKGPFAADEFFFLADRDVPTDGYYGEYPQVENGIGLTRKFIDEFEAEGFRLGKPEINGDTLVVSSPMGKWALSSLRLEGHGVRIVECENTLFGEKVNVCGLMTGVDVGRALEGIPEAGTALLPDVALEDGLFIDGYSTAEVSESCGVDIRPIEVYGGSLVSALTEGTGDK